MKVNARHLEAPRPTVFCESPQNRQRRRHAAAPWHLHLAAPASPCCPGRWSARLPQAGLLSWAAHPCPPPCPGAVASAPPRRLLRALCAIISPSEVGIGRVPEACSPHGAQKSPAALQGSPSYEWPSLRGDLDSGAAFSEAEGDYSGSAFFSSTKVISYL